MITRIFVLAVFASRLLADGGAILFQRNAGEYLITVFSSPAPLREGTADISVMVQTRKDLTPVMDAALTLRIESLNVKLTHNQATNKLLYAATVPLREGSHRMSLDMEHGNRVTIAEDIEVQGAIAKSQANWPYFAVLPMAIVLFAFNRWLKGEQLVRVKKKKGSP